MTDNIAVIAHRGASHEEPENTIGSMMRAIDLKVDYIELDVHLSADGIPVVIHDSTLCRTTNADKEIHVRETLLSEIKVFDAGAWFKGSDTKEKVPTLEEVLNLPLGNIKLMIEIKDDINHDLSAAVLQLTNQYPHVETLMGSFSPQTLGFIKKQNPLQPLIGIAETHDEALAFQKMQLDHLALDYSLVMEGHKFSAQKIWAFTVDDHLIAKELTKIGVQGIITNNPKQIKTSFQRSE